MCEREGEREREGGERKKEIKTERKREGQGYTQGRAGVVMAWNETHPDASMMPVFLAFTPRLAMMTAASGWKRALEKPSNALTAHSSTDQTRNWGPKRARRVPAIAVAAGQPSGPSAS